MMWKEFEEIAGYEVSYDDYSKIIEPMYMAIPDGISKQEFVKMLDKKRFALPTPASLMKKVKKEAVHLYEICGRYTDFESEQRIEKLAKEYAKRKYGLDWTNDSNVYVFFIPGYEYPEVQRGCTYKKELVIGKIGCGDYERVKLVG